MSATLFFLSLFFLFYLVKASPDPSKFLVYGPGLDPRKVMPVRYIYMQVADSSGSPIDDGYIPKEGDLSVRMEIASPQQSQYRSEVLKLNNQGLYLFRFRLSQSTVDIQLSLIYFGVQVADSPYKLYGHVYDDNCICPDMDMDKWLQFNNCPANVSQIDNDFKPFPVISMRRVVKEMSARFTNPGSVAYCRYIIKDNELYRNCYGHHVGFTFMSDPLLLNFLRKMRFPDMDFILNLGDWPLSSVQLKPALPIFSWCGSTDTFDIVLPTYELDESTFSMMDRVYTDIYRTMHDSLIYQWDKKVPKAFFRGRDSNKRRLELVQRSVKDAHGIIDARLTNMFFHKHTSDLGDLEKHIALNEFFRFKYQVSIDGTVAAYRLPFLLAGGSVVLKQDSKFYEHFYSDLVEGTHYVGLSEDLSNLDEKLAYLGSYDSEAKQISDNAQKFILSNLSPQSILCYHVKVFQQYAARLKSKVTLPKEFEHISQPDDSNCKCTKLYNPPKTEL